MQYVIQLFIRKILSFFFSLRYKVEIKGAEHIKGNGLLLLPNHVSILDAAIFQVFNWKRFRARPFATSRFTSVSFLKPVFYVLNAISVPDCTVGKNSVKLLQLEKAFQQLLDGLKKGDNILFYPAGHLKISGVEKLGGASGLHTLLTREPNLRLVLVRTSGLWGSRFSPAAQGKTPDLKEETLGALKLLFKSFFRLPKRPVTIEFAPFIAPTPLPSRMELNRLIEEWYNAPYGSSGEAVYPPFEAKKFFPPIEPREMTPLEREVADLVAEIAGRPKDEVKRETHLFYELGLDSLETTELFHLLEGKYKMTHLYSQELITPYHIALQIEGTWNSQRKQHYLKKDQKKLTLLKEQKTSFKSVERFSPEEVFISLKKSPLKFVAFDEFRGLVTPKDLLKKIESGLAKLLADERGEIPLFFPPSLDRAIATLTVHLAGKKPNYLTIEGARAEKGKIYSSQAVIGEWHGFDIGESSQRVSDLFTGKSAKKWKGTAPQFFQCGSDELPLLEALVKGIPIVSGRSHWVERF